MTETRTEISGTILHLQRLSTEDGPGIRTTVFFKGCPLRCAWCHNPESLRLKKEVQWIGNRCIGCDSCVDACEEHGLTHTEEGILRDRLVCNTCGRCVEACPSGAMEMLGKEISAAELVSELVKDRAYFEKSGGGVTLSGGEPSLQPQFAKALMQGLKQEGIHVALDTCGLCATETLRDLAEAADLILFDLKVLANDLHEKWTGAGNERVLANLQMMREVVRTSEGGKSLWIRTPLIPGATATRENIQSIGKYLGEHLDGTTTRWELCAFNNLCRDKYERLEMEWAFADTELMPAADLEQAGDWARTSGIDPQKVFVTGAARVEN